jgi:hypothetical protein
VGKVKANGSNRTKNLTSYRGRIEGKVTDKVSVGLEHEKDFAFRSGMVADDNGEILTQAVHGKARQGHITAFPPIGLGYGRVWKWGTWIMRNKKTSIGHRKNTVPPL